jgi:hypothetical protein
MQINYFRWDKKRADPMGFYRFASLMINFRRYSLHWWFIQVIINGSSLWLMCKKAFWEFIGSWKLIILSCGWLYRETESLRLGDFPTGERLEWHGLSPNNPDWSETSKFVAFTLVLPVPIFYHFIYIFYCLYTITLSLFLTRENPQTTLQISSQLFGGKIIKWNNGLFK